MLKYSNLSMTIEHVKNDSPSQRVYLQKIGLKRKSRASRKTKTRFKSISTKGENRTCKKKINFRHTN
jgi:hypothetical protein